jgi:DNA ligase-1
MLTLNIISKTNETNVDTQLVNTNINGYEDCHTNMLQEEKEEVRMDQTPTKSKWALVPLYKLSATGSMLVWQIGFDGVNHLEISHGYDDGIIRTDRTEIKINGSGRCMQEQALQDARQRYKLKYKEGYQPAGSTTPPLVKAMKGYEYTQKSIKNWPVYTQPKLNGIRMLCQDNGAGTIAMRSWLNNPFTHITHIESELKDFFPYLPRYCTLDGEMYNHSMDFTVLTSAVKTIKSVHPHLQDVQYWIFDINYEDTEGTPFEKRCSLLINAFRKYIQDRSPIGSPEDISVLPKTFYIVPTQIARTHVEILQQHNQHVAVGYEGIMIKKISNGYMSGSKEYNESLYRAGKCNHILKYKEFIDEEAIILSVTEAEGTEKGAAIFNVQDHRGNIFPIRMRGNMDRRRYWFSNPHLVIGKEVTIRYQELSIYKVPRFPVGIAIRDYE